MMREELGALPALGTALEGSQGSLPRLSQALLNSPSVRNLKVTLIQAAPAAEVRVWRGSWAKVAAAGCSEALTFIIWRPA